MLAVSVGEERGGGGRGREVERGGGGRGREVESEVGMQREVEREV